MTQGELIWFSTHRTLIRCDFSVTRVTNYRLTIWADRGGISIFSAHTTDGTRNLEQSTPRM